MESIGIRELRQHASRYVSRVEHGETIEVTDRGRPVALMVPISADTWESLIASGRLSLPTLDGDITDDEPVDYGIAASARLAEMRDAESR